MRDPPHVSPSRQGIERRLRIIAQAYSELKKPPPINRQAFSISPPTEAAYALPRAALARIFGRSTRKYLRTNRPSRPLRGPPQPRHISWLETDTPSASARTSLYRIPHVGHANGVGGGITKGSTSAIQHKVN